MKKTIYLIFCLLAFASFCCLSCGKEDGGDTNLNNTDYAKMIVGTWRVDNMTLNGENFTPENFLIIMNSDGTGLLNDNGETENNQFTWSVSDKVLTIVHRHGQGDFNISSISDTEATLEGNTVPGSDGIDGDVVMHLNRVR